MVQRWRVLFRDDRKVALTLVYAVVGLPVCFVVQCLVRGWDRWVDALVFSVVAVLVLGAAQYLMVRDPPSTR